MQFNGKEIKNPALDKYDYTGDNISAICGACGLEYNLKTVSEKHIEAMIARGSKLFKPKEKPAAGNDGGDKTGKK